MVLRQFVLIHLLRNCTHSRLFMRLFVVLCVLYPVACLLADDTALNDGSEGPMPVGGLNGPESVIQMVSEAIDVDMGRKVSDVDCHFTFRSHKRSGNAFQLVGFPDLAAAVAEAERRTGGKRDVSWKYQEPTTGPIENMQTFVNGQAVKAELKYGWVSFRDGYMAFAPENDQDRILMAWYTVPVSFPPERDVLIERRYRVPNGLQVFDVVIFNYSTATGGVWKDAIEQMVVNVNLRDGLNVNDLEWPEGRSDEQIGQTSCSPDRKEWKVISRTELQLVWSHFEPRTEENRREFRLATKAAKHPAE
jgi:hypothetical protein